MKKLGLLSTLCLGLMATGCIISSGDDDPLTARIDLQWTLDGGCPVGGTTVQALLTDSVGTEFEDLFDCSDGGGITRPLFLDDYDVVLNITDDTTNTLFASSGSLRASLILDGEELPLDFAFPTDGAFFELTWNVADTAGAPLTCAEVDGTDVSVDATLVGSTTLFDETFACSAGAGTTQVIDLGSYTVAIDILDNTGGSLLAAPLTASETLDVGNEIVDLGDFTFEFLPL